MDILNLILEGGLFSVFISLFSFLSSLLGFLSFLLPNL